MAVKRIAQVTAFWGPAYPTGSGVFCYEISKRLAMQSEVHVYTSNLGNFNALENIDNLYVHPQRTYLTAWDMNPLANVFTRLLNDDYDIVHVHSYIFFLSNQAALAKFFKRRHNMVLHFHGGLDIDSDSHSFQRFRIWAKENLYDRTLGRFTVKSADKLLSVSQSDIPIIQRKFGVNEVDWIPNAVDTEKFLPSEAEDKPSVILYAGKLEKWKGLEILIEALSQIKREIKGVELLVAGVGSLEGKLRGSALPIRCLGHVPYEKMPEVYQKASLVILPSFMEGLPSVCVEALSCGVPVVATDVGDTGKLVLNGETGFLVKPGHAEEIASGAIEILKDNRLRERMGSNGRKHVELNFSYDETVRRISAVYESLAPA
ncbi:glycosyltransferase family 4 protein [Chloroflexota bacterium]